MGAVKPPSSDSQSSSWQQWIGLFVGSLLAIGIGVSDAYFRQRFAIDVDAGLVLVGLGGLLGHSVILDKLA